MDEIQILQDQLRSVPKEIRAFLARDEWSNIVQKISQRNNFSAEQKTALENEVIFVLVGMDSRENFKENIRNTTGIQEFLAREIEYEIDENIFKKVESFLSTETEAEPVQKISENKPVIPEILTQQKVTAVEIPPANLPMIEPGEVVHDTKPQMTAPVIETKPDVLQPTIKPSTSTPPKPINNHYPNGQDPYREPLI